MKVSKDSLAVLDAIAVERGLDGRKPETRGAVIEMLLASYTASQGDVALSDEDSKHIDRAVELGADRAELAATGLVWAAKSYASRQTSKAVQHDLDVEAMDDRELESFGDTKNHPEVSRERVRRTIARIDAWNKQASEAHQIVLSATYTDKLRKELWALTGGEIAQVSRRLIMEVLEDVECDPLGLGQFQNRKIPALSIGVHAFRDLVDELAPTATEAELASRHYEAVNNLDLVA